MSKLRKELDTVNIQIIAISKREMEAAYASVKGQPYEDMINPMLIHQNLEDKRSNIIRKLNKSIFVKLGFGKVVRK